MGKKWDTVKKEDRKKAYAPYQKESLYCLPVDISCVALMIVFFIYDEKAFFCVTLAWELLWIFLNHRITLLSFGESLFCHWESQELTLLKDKTEASFYARTSDSIYLLYPENLRVRKYKIICKNNQGKQIVLRSVMSASKAQLLADTMPMTCVVLYGRFSHIVFRYQSKEEWAYKCNHKF